MGFLDVVGSAGTAVSAGKLLTLRAKAAEAGVYRQPTEEEKTYYNVQAPRWLIGEVEHEGTEYVLIEEPEALTVIDVMASEEWTTPNLEVSEF